MYASSHALQTSASVCAQCGAGPADGKTLLRCSRCLGAKYCSANCQKAAWPQHKPECTRCRKLDVQSATPLLAAFAFMPRISHIPVELYSEVFKRNLFGKELHLHFRNPGQFRSETDFDVSRSCVGPSSAQLHSMAMHNGYVEAATVGSLFAFHRAVEQYNNRHAMGLPAAASSRAAPGSPSPPSHDYVMPVYGDIKITEYGIAIGSTCPEYTLVYHHQDGKVTQLQDPNNHVWMYFRSEKADKLYLDVGSMPYGFALMFNVVNYLPLGTREHTLLRSVPGGQLCAPAWYIDVEGAAREEGYQQGFMQRVSTKHLAERQRLPITGLAADLDPEQAIRALLQQLRDAVAAAEPTPGAPAAAANATCRGRAAASSAAGTSSGGYGAQAAGVAGAAAAAPAAAVRPHVPFRDGSLDRHVQRAMEHFEVAYDNTYAVLEQGTYKNYPRKPESQGVMRWCKDPCGPVGRPPSSSSSSSGGPGRQRG